MESSCARGWDRDDIIVLTKISVSFRAPVRSASAFTFISKSQSFWSDQEAAVPALKGTDDRTVQKLKRRTLIPVLQLGTCSSYNKIEETLEESIRAGLTGNGAVAPPPSVMQVAARETGHSLAHS